MRDAKTRVACGLLLASEFIGLLLERLLNRTIGDCATLRNFEGTVAGRYERS
jgi:hypothetical protein